MEQLSYPDTYYAATRVYHDERPSLQGVQHCRVCVIGGGFAGIMTAFGLVERGWREVILLEKNRLGWGCSGRNGGFVFGGYSLDCASLARQAGQQKAKSLYQLTVDAVQLIRRRITQYQIDCQPVFGGVLLANWFKDNGVLNKTQSFMRDAMGVDWPLIDGETLRAEHIRSQRYSGALIEPYAFHFHPLNYALGMAKTAAQWGVQFFEQTPALDIETTPNGYCIRTPAGEVHAEQVVVTGGGYFEGFMPPISRTVLPVATYVMTTEPLGARIRELLPTEAAVYDTRFAFDYYRRLPDDRLLWGGRISVFEPDAQRLKSLLRRDLARVFPELRDAAISHVWSGWMGYSRHKMPEIGQWKPGFWHLVGFGGHGVAPTTLGAELVATAITQNDRRYQAFAAWPLVWAGGPVLGRAAAQLTYWWYELKDWLKERLER